jgi:hypothetical protein
MNIGDHFVNLIVVWNNYTDKKIIRYELYVGKCYETEPWRLTTGENAGKIIDIPKCTTVISNVKITKTQAKELQKFIV